MHKPATIQEAVGTIVAQFLNNYYAIFGNIQSRTYPLIITLVPGAISTQNFIGGLEFNGWHHGIVGLVAARLKENLHRPVIAMAPSEDGSGEVRGSARSIPGFHMRDALAIVDARNPGLIAKFGGHAMAAGLSLHTSGLDQFKKQFDAVAQELLNDDLLSAVVHSDGELPPEDMNLDFARYLETCGPWGQAFPEPVFDNIFYCEDYVVLGGKHLKMSLIDPRSRDKYEAIFFGGCGGPEPVGMVRVAYELGVHVWRERETLQLMVRHLQKAL